MTKPLLQPLYHMTLSLPALHDNLQHYLDDSGIRIVQNQQIETGPKPSRPRPTVDIRIYDDVTIDEMRRLIAALDAIMMTEESRLVEQGISMRREESADAAG